MTEAFVTPKLVEWARTRYALTTRAVAEKINVRPERIDAWESGDARPTLRQAHDLARKLNVPLGYFYLSSPPSENLPLPDLRTVAGAPPRKPSPNFLDLLQDVLRKQEWYREQPDRTALEFVGRFGMNDDVKVVAADIRRTLGLNDELRRTAGTWEQFLTEFVRRAEGAGVLVLRSSIVGSNTHRHLDVGEFRGFAISDTLSPLVFINSADAKAAQIFTLAHELAHLWLGESGVSNPDFARGPSQQQHIVDRQCDRIAAETLVPADDFLRRWSDSKILDDNLRDLASLFRVSAFVVLRRALELEQIQSDEYRAKYKELLETPHRKPTSEGGDFYRTFLARNSSTLATALIVATAEGRVPPTEAASLLNVRIGTLGRIEQYVLGGGATGA
jgi:Zn-dependent peptidase ImmA (M78 family)/DNA-binding XRE family transcriptional regulator